LTEKPVYIRGAGIISPLGSGLAATEKTLRENRSALQPLTLFPLLQGAPLPVGQVPGLDEPSSVPRTHQLALIAARQAMDGSDLPPDAIILGTTTGGILTTEQLLREDEQKKELYRHHGLATVVNFIARELNCTGPAIVVSTACSSGVVAIALALKMLRSGQAGTVLAGGVDSLSRLTYFGFNSLQLVDSSGCKPLDQNRQGMAVAEGAGMLLLSAEKTADNHAELLGAGLSCDAYHPAAPHPDGMGAFSAMQKALTDAGLSPEEIDYINFHGTGTPDNDLAESKAVLKLFPIPPPLSSIKGASGHSLAAAGAIEAVVAAITVSQGLIPANTNLQQVDPLLGLTPTAAPLETPVQTVLSNSFGFGGNNGSLVIGRPGVFSPGTSHQSSPGLAIHGYSCLTGAGDTVATIDRLKNGVSAAGRAALNTISANLPPRLIRRLKRLPKMTLALSVGAQGASNLDGLKPDSVFMGTGWGALSETHDFLTRLADSNEQFPSPTDFVGSVHNGPASQVAIIFGATGPNITTSGGDYSFEQALLAAELMIDDPAAPALILGADEGHDTFSPLFDPSIPPGSFLADGGGAFCVSRRTQGAKCCISIPFYQSSERENAVATLLDTLGTISEKDSGYALILAGIPAAHKSTGEKQLEQFISLSNSSVPILNYRKLTGEFATASAVATAFAASFIEAGKVPGVLVGGSDIGIDRRMNKILVLGLGQYITAIELYRP
jgi:3-oxoacyl-(acyl-carrier-protein) synthase